MLPWWTLKLYYAKRKAFINFLQKCHKLSGPKVIYDGPKDNRNFSLFFGKKGSWFYVPKMKKTIQTVTTQKSAETSPCDGMRVHYCPWHGGDLHKCEGTIDGKRLMLEFERHMLPSRRRLFPRTPCPFQQDNARPHSAQVTTVWLCWPDCSPNLSPIEHVLAHHTYVQGWARTVWAAQVLYYTKTMGKNVHFAKLKQLISSVPKRLQSVIKRKGNVTK